MSSHIFNCCCTTAQPIEPARSPHPSFSPALDPPMGNHDSAPRENTDGQQRRDFCTRKRVNVVDPNTATWYVLTNAPPPNYTKKQITAHGRRVQGAVLSAATRHTLPRPPTESVGKRRNDLTVLVDLTTVQRNNRDQTQRLIRWNLSTNSDVGICSCTTNFKDVVSAVLS